MKAVLSMYLFFQESIEKTIVATSRVSRTASILLFVVFLTGGFAQGNEVNLKTVQILQSFFKTLKLL